MTDNNIFGGRINRKNYILGLLFFKSWLLFPFLIIAILEKVLARETINSLSTFFLVALVVLFGLAIYFSISLHIRRLQDLNINKYNVLLLLIPGFNLLMLAYLWIMPGKPEINQYGASVPQNEPFFDVIFNRGGNITANGNRMIPIAATSTITTNNNI